ncbi:MAG: uracil-DNA glycosylase [Alphaproteobacteria bacterium]|nr:uracil-DNA glycosylase [Alphaproteobacteria bacterium]
MPHLPASLTDRLAQEAARGDMNIDLPVYTQAGRPPHAPVLLGSGSLGARLGFFGRDPGRNEVLHGEPFIGKGGQLIRDGLYRAAHGCDAPDIEAAIKVGTRVFWVNTVPYKPVGNKAWSVPIKRRFLPMIAELLVDHWVGCDLITLGNVAFDWFGLADPVLKPALADFWSRDDRYSASLEVTLRGKRFRLHPLPHPSPLNATWFPRFPGLLDDRLAALGWTGD